MGSVYEVDPVGNQTCRTVSVTTKITSPEFHGTAIFIDGSSVNSAGMSSRVLDDTAGDPSLSWGLRLFYNAAGSIMINYNGPNDITFNNKNLSSINHISANSIISNPTTTVIGDVGVQPMSVNNTYIAINAATLQFSLPATCSIGQFFEILCFGSGLVQVTQNSGQTIHFGNQLTTTGVSGYLQTNDVSNSNSYLKLVCVNTNTDFMLLAPQGNPVTF
jgi:hypothetical protein